MAREKKSMNKVTMQDIADALGISRVTVWKVFNNYTNVSASVREKVLLKAKELGYTKGLAEVDDGVLEIGRASCRDRVCMFV